MITIKSDSHFAQLDTTIDQLEISDGEAYILGVRKLKLPPIWHKILIDRSNKKAKAIEPTPHYPNDLNKRGDYFYTIKIKDSDQYYVMPLEFRGTAPTIYDNKGNFYETWASTNFADNQYYWPHKREKRLGYSDAEHSYIPKPEWEAFKDVKCQTQIPEFVGLPEGSTVAISISAPAPGSIFHNTVEDKDGGPSIKTKSVVVESDLKTTIEATKLAISRINEGLQHYYGISIHLIDLTNGGERFEPKARDLSDVIQVDDRHGDIKIFSAEMPDQLSKLKALASNYSNDTKIGVSTGSGWSIQLNTSDDMEIIKPGSWRAWRKGDDVIYDESTIIEHEIWHLLGVGHFGKKHGTPELGINKSYIVPVVANVEAFTPLENYGENIVFGVNHGLADRLTIK